MKDIIPTEYRSLVMESNGQPVTTSLKVAEHFGKRHGDVLRKIREMKCTLSFRQRNFASTVIQRPNPSGGRPLESLAFEITKDGFFFLAFGFSGKKADVIKENYIDAFNWMESLLLGGLKDTFKRLAAVERTLATMNANASEGGRQMALKRWHVKPLQIECDRLWQKTQPMLPHI